MKDDDLTVELLTKEYQKELPKPNTEWPHEVKEMIQFLNKHLFDKTLSIKKAKDHCYSNGNYISSLFRHHVGVSPKEYVINHRLAAGKKLLRNKKGVSIFVVSICVGYSGSGAFTHMFKKRTGLSPTEWRRENLKENEEK